MIIPEKMSLSYLIFLYNRTLMIRYWKTVSHYLKVPNIKVYYRKIGINKNLLHYFISFFKKWNKFNGSRALVSLISIILHLRNWKISNFKLNLGKSNILMMTSLRITTKIIAFRWKESSAWQNFEL